MRQLNTETKYFFKAGSVIFELAKRQKVPLSMAIVDIDDLSLINQKYGDRIADMIVEDVNQSLVKKCRKSDLVSYLGEGRFGLLLYNISGINADIVLNDIRKMVAKKRYRLKEEILQWVRDNKMPDNALDRFIDLRVDIIIGELKNILQDITFEVIDTQEGQNV